MKYNIGRFSVKAWKYLLWFFVNACLVNAYILYANTSTRPTKKKYTHLDFRLDVVHGLIASFSAREQKSGALLQIRPGALNDQLTHENVDMGVKAKRCRWHYMQKGEKKQCTGAGFAMSICAKMAAILNITANNSIRI